jgi:hypothetical protein
MNKCTVLSKICHVTILNPPLQFLQYFHEKNLHFCAYSGLVAVS